ncbi:MAG: hypothetical protein ACQESR_11285 [Planctomycetota bacterium]
MESCPAPAALPLVGLAAEKLIRDRYSIARNVIIPRTSRGHWPHPQPGSCDNYLFFAAKPSRFAVFPLRVKGGKR